MVRLLETALVLLPEPNRNLVKFTRIREPLAVKEDVLGKPEAGSQKRHVLEHGLQQAAGELKEDQHDIVVRSICKLDRNY